MRDEWLLAQPRLTLPATSPDPLACGEWRWRLAVNRGNDFGWRQTKKGELPAGGDRRFLVDGEHMTADLGLRHGLTSSWDVGVRLPVHWRGAGFMDAIIDEFHGFTGFLDNIRSAFTNDLFRIEGRDANFTPFSWNDETGWGLGNVELATHWTFLNPRSPSRLTAALIGRLTLPTGTGPYEVGGVDAGAQLVVGLPLGRTFELYAGAGATWFGEPEIDGVIYERVRAMGFVAVEWHPARTWSLIVELNGSTRLVTSIAEYPDVQLYVNIGAKIDLSRRWLLEAGFTENLHDQQSTTDFGAYLGLVTRM